VTGAGGDKPAEEPAFPLSMKESDGFAGRSAALGNILRADEATRIVAAYEREDRRAIDEQRRFSYVATHLNASVLMTAGVGALILTLGVLRPCFRKTSTRGSSRSSLKFWRRSGSSDS
jgi:hypothetical protein